MGEGRSSEDGAKTACYYCFHFIVASLLIKICVLHSGSWFLSCFFRGSEMFIDYCARCFFERTYLGA